jgi:sulfur relay (sulfurtransferase) DsrC/TusE family protein
MYLCSGFRRKEEIMCTCIAEIKASYTKVRHQTAEVAQQQFDIDDYLDKVIVVRKKLEQITEETNSLVETVRDHFTEFDVQETTELLAHSTPILILMDQLHQKLVESPLYPGLKTAVENYCDCVSIFQELCSDLQTFNIDIPRNEKSREVEELLRKLA